LNLMGKEASIASVTVAYNGASVLARHLDALKRQTHKIDEIVVVNNASTDQTQYLIGTEYPEVTILNEAMNGGVGGGYAAGLAYTVLKKKYDWVWLFDQDSVPSEDGLERLLLGLQRLDGISESTAILAPVCRDSQGSQTCPGMLWRNGHMVPVAGEPGKPITLVDLVISSGSLIRKEAIEAVGVPRADFFMDFVDYEHCLRLRRYGFNIAVVEDSLLHHTLGESAKFRIFGRTKYWTDHVPWREYYKTRNEIYTTWQYFPEWKIRALTVYRLVRHTIVLLVFGKRRLACLGMIGRGFSDGLKRKLGIRFPLISE
jgi:GT2 family glycosyltransferase